MERGVNFGGGVTATYFASQGKKDPRCRRRNGAPTIGSWGGELQWGRDGYVGFGVPVGDPGTSPRGLEQGQYCSFRPHRDRKCLTGIVTVVLWARGPFSGPIVWWASLALAHSPRLGVSLLLLIHVYMATTMKVQLVRKYLFIHINYRQLHYSYTTP